MKLVKDIWKREDIREFQNYLEKFSNAEKREWSTNILKTSLPVLCMKTKDIKYIVDEIFRGNYLSFLDLMIWEYYENTAINGMLISKINDFDTMKVYLDIYSAKADNWATCDLLTFNIKNEDDKYYLLSLEYIKSDKPFVRRIGLYILFLFINDSKYTSKIFDILDSFDKENEYYVNMMCSWILCELIIRMKGETIKYLNRSKLNNSALNKGIQKCRESRRLSKEEKDDLIKYKRK